MSINLKDDLRLDKLTKAYSGAKRSTIAYDIFKAGMEVFEGKSNQPTEQDNTSLLEDIEKLYQLKIRVRMICF